MKMKWYGHVTRSAGLAKTILQGTVLGEDGEADSRKGERTTFESGQGCPSPDHRGWHMIGTVHMAGDCQWCLNNLSWVKRID